MNDTHQKPTQPHNGQLVTGQQIWDAMQTIYQRMLDDNFIKDEQPLSQEAADQYDQAFKVLKSFQDLACPSTEICWGGWGPRWRLIAGDHHSYVLFICDCCAADGIGDEVVYEQPFGPSDPSRPRMEVALKTVPYHGSTYTAALTRFPEGFK